MTMQWGRHQPRSGEGEVLRDAAGAGHGPIGPATDILMPCRGSLKQVQ